MTTALHALTSRVLEPEEWPRLKGTELEQVWPHLNPEMTRILVVEDDYGVIVGCWALVRVWHVEGLWIDPKHRVKASVGRRLLTGMKRLARAVGAKVLVTASVSEDVTQMILAAGGDSLPGQHFVLPVGED
jgi:hypothetical protein